MDGPRKRTLTEEGREIASTADQSALDTGLAPELAISLRNVGARVRHSVSHGYRTPPSNSFVKAQSTGTIFRSTRDTLRHVHTDLSTTGTLLLDSTKKRARSVENDECEVLESQQKSNQSSPHQQTQATRLKISSRFRAPSLPSGLPSVADPGPHMTEVVEEEDWSLDMSSEIPKLQHEAMEF